MKRIIVLTIIMLILTGCSKIEKATPIIENLSCVAEVKYNYINYVCNIELQKDELMLSVVQPKEISGLLFKINKDKISTEYMGITNSSEFTETQHYSLAYVLFNVINSVKGKEIKFNDTNGVICSDVDGYKYEFVFSPTGLPISISIDDIDYNAYFKDVSIKHGG